MGKEGGYPVNRELDDFAASIYGAYNSFRVAGFDEKKAFALATAFMIQVMSQQAAIQAGAGDDKPAASLLHGTRPAS